MPKLEIKETPFIKEIRELHKKFEGFITEDQIEELIAKYDQEVVGHGAECVVMPDEKEDKVVSAFNYEDVTPEKAKRIFYSQRIFSTLFPHNFPNFYAAFGNTLDNTIKGVAGTKREKITESYFKNTPTFPLDQALKKSEELGLLILRPSLDLNYFKGEVLPDDPNLILGKDGGQYYADTVTLLPHEINELDTTRVAELMNENGYTDKQIRIVSSSINRLKEIFK